MAEGMSVDVLVRMFLRDQSSVWAVLSGDPENTLSEWGERMKAAGGEYKTFVGEATHLMSDDSVLDERARLVRDLQSGTVLARMVYGPSMIIRDFARYSMIYFCQSAPPASVGCASSLTVDLRDGFRLVKDRVRAAERLMTS